MFDADARAGLADFVAELEIRGRRVDLRRVTIVVDGMVKTELDSGGLTGDRSETEVSKMERRQDRTSVK